MHYLVLDINGKLQGYFKTQKEVYDFLKIDCNSGAVNHNLKGRLKTITNKNNGMKVVVKKGSVKI